ncbi:MAG: type II toxin-antitoxin system HicB family antitoxin [Desulfovibrio sp.]|nr:type II toxin-antitoxin system HicB family antitoxin [Desulfovibrio sp.]
MEQVNMIPVEVHFKPSAKYRTASCPGLDLATQGETFERAEQNIREALTLFVESCLRRGTLEEVLHCLGRKGKSRVRVKSDPICPVHPA